MQKCIVVPNLNDKCALGNRWPEGIRSQHLGDPLRQPQSLEPGSGQDETIVVAGVQLSQSRIDVAADVTNDEVAAQCLQLRHTPNARCADNGTGRERCKQDMLATDEHVEGTRPLGHTSQRQAGCFGCWQILETVHGGINRTG